MGANRSDINRRSFKAPHITISLVIVHLIVYGCLCHAYPGQSEEAVRLWAYPAARANLIGLFTYSFVHLDKYHLIISLLCLWSVGSMLETRRGAGSLLFFYLGGGVLVAGVYGIFLNAFDAGVRSFPLAGAFGPLACVLGAYTAFFIANREDKPVHLMYPFLAVSSSFKVLALIPVSACFVAGLPAVFQYQSPAFPVYLSLAGGSFSGFVFGLILAKYERFFSSEEHKQEPAKDTLYKDTASVCSPVALYEQLDKYPDNPLIMLRLARAEVKAGKRNKGEKFYRKAIHELYRRGERALAAVVFEEFFVNYGKVFCGPLQIQLSRELIKKERYELAALALEAFIRSVEVSPDLLKEPQLMPKAYVTLGKLFADKLERQDVARRVFYEFLVKYPFAEQRSMVVRKLKLFNRPMAAPAKY